MRLTEDQKDLLVQACQRGATIEEAARQFYVSASTVDRILRERRRTGEFIRLNRGRPPNKWKPKNRSPSFDIRPVPLSTVKDLCALYHAYRSIGAYSIYSFAVFENDKIVAAFSWQSPPFGSAQTLCPEAPSGVLALSRMIAVPRAERRLRHISKPLRYQMRNLIDRTRWPVLVTYSDEGLGHTGHVYKCSGWQPDKRTHRSFFIDENGCRRSVPARKDPEKHYLRYGGKTTLQRWVHRICAPGSTLVWMQRHGWRRIEDLEHSTTTKWIRVSR